MFYVHPDAWATVIAVLIICIGIFASITSKLRVKRTKADKLWYANELSLSIFAAVMAWDMHPHLPLPEWITRTVFTGVAAYLGSRFIQIIRDKMTKQL